MKELNLVCLALRHSLSIFGFEWACDSTKKRSASPKWLQLLLSLSSPPGLAFLPYSELFPDFVDFIFHQLLEIWLVSFLVNPQIGIPKFLLNSAVASAVSKGHPARNINCLVEHVLERNLTN